jgi:hypothetical protein
VRDAIRRGDLYAETSMRWANNMLWLVSDDVEEAPRNLESATWTPPSRGYHLQHMYEEGSRAEIAVYEDNMDDLNANVPRKFRQLTAARSLLLRVQIVRALVHWMFGKGCVARSANGLESKHYLAEARRNVRRLAREKVGYARTWSLLVNAAIEFQMDRPEQTIDLLTDTITTAEGNHMFHLVAAARRRLGEITGGDEGAALIELADDWMTSQGVVNPKRFTEILAPGFRKPSKQLTS